MLEGFKNSLPTRLYWVLFAVENLRQAEETSKRILPKEKIDRQLADQWSCIPFMNIKDGYISKIFTFDMQNSLDDKVDRLTLMMSKLTTWDDNQNKQLKPKIYKSKQRGQTRNFYDKNNYYPEITKIDICQIVGIGEHHIEVEVVMDKITEEDHITLIIIEMTSEETISEKCKITEDKIIEVDAERILEMIILEEVGVCLKTDNIHTILEGIIEVVVGLDQVQELAPIDIELDAISVGNMISLLWTIQLCK